MLKKHTILPRPKSKTVYEREENEMQTVSNKSKILCDDFE